MRNQEQQGGGQARPDLEGLLAIRDAAQRVSDAWESDNLSPEHTAYIMRLMHRLAVVLDEARGEVS